MLVMTGTPFAFANNAFTNDFNKSMRPDYDIPGEHICCFVIQHFTQAIASLAAQGAQQHQNIRYDTDRLRVLSRHGSACIGIGDIGMMQKWCRVCLLTLLLRN